jgi:uncharacterized membrane protein YjjP (DUF1212 family)
MLLANHNRYLVAVTVRYSPDSVTASAAVAFVLRLGRALHAYGYAAHQLEGVLRQAAERLGLSAQFFATPTSIFASFGPQDDQRTHLMRVEPGDVDLGKLALLDGVARDVLDGRVSPADGSRRIEQITRASSPYGRALTVAAFTVASGAACRILGGGAREIVASSLIGLVTGVLAIVSARAPGLRRVFEPTAALVASAIATIIAVRAGPLSMYVTTLAGLIVLLPGLTFTLALTELTTQNLLSGTARFAASMVVFLGIALGVALGQKTAHLMLGAPVPPNSVVAALPGWTEWIALLLAPFAFAVLLKAQPRDTLWTLAVCLLGFEAGRLGSRLFDPQLGVFFGALTVGIASNLYGRFARRPAPVTQVPGILLLLPGSIGFRSLAAMLDQQTLSGIESFFAMVLTAAALVTGLLTANVLAPPERWSGAGGLAGIEPVGVERASREYRVPTKSD